jgi:nucleotide-binding universal stress UspA family protein
MTMKKNILMPFDGSTNATDALKEAITIAKALGEKIVLLNVQPTFETVHTKIFFTPKDVEQYQEQLCRETVAPALEILKQSEVPFEVRLRAGNPKDVIVEEAGKCGVRMIVMGSRGLNVVAGLFLGSTSYGVLQEAPCPVVVVPYREPAEKAAANPELP